MFIEIWMAAKYINTIYVLHGMCTVMGRAVRSRVTCFFGSTTVRPRVMIGPNQEVVSSIQSRTLDQIRQFAPFYCTQGANCRFSKCWTTVRPLLLLAELQQANCLFTTICPLFHSRQSESKNVEKGDGWRKWPCWELLINCYSCSLIYY